MQPKDPKVNLKPQQRGNTRQNQNSSSTAASKSTPIDKGNDSSRQQSQREGHHQANKPTQHQGVKPAPVQADKSREKEAKANPPAAAKSGAKPTASIVAKKLCFQRVGIFIDAENIELSGLKHFEGFTNYKMILESVGDREVIRIIYYKPEYKEVSTEFQNFWAGMGGEIRRPAKNADTFLVIDAVTMADKMDVAIILGGDKDFLPLVWYLKSRGCRTEIWSWPQATSQEVKEAADQYFPLDETYLLGDDKKKDSRRKRN